MGAWGCEAFANDYALDDAAMLASKTGVMTAIGKLLEMTDADGPDEWFVYTGYGAAEVVAAAVSVEPYYQSEGTTLFARISGGEATPYLPEEIAAWLAQERPRFERPEVEAAIAAIDILSRPEMLEPWSHPDERLAALVETRQRLSAALMPAHEAS